MPKPDNKERKPIVKDDVTNKTFDSQNEAKVLGPNGQVIREPGKARKELVEELLILIQNTVDDKIGGIGFLTKVDLLENHIHGVAAYSNSLKEAAEAIVNRYPTPDERDVPLQELSELCDVIAEGVERVTPYVDAIKSFSDDLDRIKTEIYTQVQMLFQEI